MLLQFVIAALMYGVATHYMTIILPAICCGIILACLTLFVIAASTVRSMSVLYVPRTTIYVGRTAYYARAVVCEQRPLLEYVVHCV